MSSSNPYSSPETPGRRGDHEPRFSVTGAAAFLLGCVCSVTAWTGCSQLIEFASPTSDGILSRFPILKPVWEFFAPDSGIVEVANVASKVQFTFLMLGFIGFITIVTGIVLLFQGYNRRKT